MSQGAIETAVEAIRGATSDGGRVLLKFDASWCSMCQELDRQVLQTGPGRALLEGVETVRVDFDDPASPPLVERYAILELPTAVVLGPDGAELGRVVGFEEAAAWVDQARTALSGEDPMPGWREAAESGEPDALLTLGEALLSRDPVEGLAVLERVAWGNRAPAAWALHMIGRYRHRARRDPASALSTWRELATRFLDLPIGVLALEWHARAQTELGRPELGSAAFVELADDPRAVAAWARWAGRAGYEPARAAIRDAAMNALKRARGAQREDLERLVMGLGTPFEPPDDGPPRG